MIKATDGIILLKQMLSEKGMDSHKAVADSAHMDLEWST